jgi:hypothetical protein
MKLMFRQAEGFKNQDLSMWAVNKVKHHDNFIYHAGDGNIEPIWK